MQQDIFFLIECNECECSKRAAAEGDGLMHQVKTEDELKAQLDNLSQKELQDHLCFIEICLDPEDCSKELLEFGARLGPYNARPPKPV